MSGRSRCGHDRFFYLSPGLIRLQESSSGDLCLSLRRRVLTDGEDMRAPPFGVAHRGRGDSKAHGAYREIERALDRGSSTSHRGFDRTGAGRSLVGVEDAPSVLPNSCSAPNPLTCSAARFTATYRNSGPSSISHTRTGSGIRSRARGREVLVEQRRLAVECWFGHGSMPPQPWPSSERYAGIQSRSRHVRHPPDIEGLVLLASQQALGTKGALWKYP